MRSVTEMLEWVGSHANRFRRQGYEPPNHLANGTIRFFGSDGPTFDLRLDANGKAPEYTHDPPPSRIEIYGGSGELLYTEQA